MKAFTFAESGTAIVISSKPWTVSFGIWGSSDGRHYGQDHDLKRAFQKLRERIAATAAREYAGVS